MSQWDIGFKFNFEQDFHYKYGFFTAFLFQIFTLIFRYKNCKQRLHVHLGNREYRRLLLGTPQTPSYRKRTSFFIIMWRTSKRILGRRALWALVRAYFFGRVLPVSISHHILVTGLLFGREIWWRLDSRSEQWEKPVSVQHRIFTLRYMWMGRRWIRCSSLSRIRMANRCPDFFVSWAFFQKRKR